jgi:hypothetical protein
MMKRDKTLQVTGYQYNSEQGYGDCPLVLNQSVNCRERTRYIQMEDWIRSMLSQPTMLSYNIQQPFLEPGNDVLQSLKGLRWQRFFYGELWSQGFSCENIPFKLEKWDPENNQWNMLTIDSHVMVAAYLAYLCKNPTEKFDDYLHSHQLIEFTTKVFYKPPTGIISRNHGYNAVLDYIEVTPILVTPAMTPGEGNVEESLRLTTSRSDLFPDLRFTTPAVLAPTPDDFRCSICLSGCEIMDPCEKVFRTGCSQTGHSFHRQCIEHWFSTMASGSCPICRATIKHSIV